MVHYNNDHKAVNETDIVIDCIATYASEEDMKRRTPIAGEGEELAGRCRHVRHGAEL